MPMPGSHTFVTTSKLLIPYLEASPSYVQLVPKLIETNCVSTPFSPADPVCRPAPHIAGELPQTQLTGVDAIPD